MKAASIHNYRLLTKKRAPHFLFEYLDGGSYEETTMGRNAGGNGLDELSNSCRVIALK